ncbi:3-phosphoserine/phosphohydroxythreonine transaminase [Alteribacter keqinensis]|uniref:Phosphoserine aminotransferase n=1 Tax=Alteribacter keqinensis TaxID=2483800 RepID=A0A3M7TUM7_9BACI|nr:3-phosphoserine/phosphohydroxythreonine transaminase [Alteribacter keqinensis]RNA68712.1 3-phosphoserine/phosphohydroxythreonine transaminase [Alteribacter keqinensis]
MYNFNPGPAALPAEVKRRAKEEGFSPDLAVMEMSHRSKEYEDIHFGTKEKIKKLLSVPDSYDILFLQGGASLQFAMLPMNFLTPGKKAGYVLTGAWSEKALEEASRCGDTYVYASSADNQYRSIPQIHTWEPEDNTAYLHLTSNNTIYGTQWYSLPEHHHDFPVCVDASSDIFSRPVNWSKVDLMYAGAQKNAGPSGVTVVIVKKAWLEEAETGIPKILQYSTHQKKDSLYHTPPTFSIFTMGLMMDWLEKQGGVEKIYETNAQKASSLYKMMDESDHFYQPHADTLSRSTMNITFRLPSVELEQEFLSHAQKEGFIGLKGHRSIGGCRISLYNAVTLQSANALHDFMISFRQNHSC